MKKVTLTLTLTLAVNVGMLLPAMAAKYTTAHVIDAVKEKAAFDRDYAVYKEKLDAFNKAKREW